jgi:hypothetical protein
VQDLVSAIKAVISMSRSYGRNSELESIALDDKHVKPEAYEEVYPQVRISAKLAELLISAFDLSNARYSYFHYDDRVLHTKEARDTKVVRSLILNRSAARMVGNTRTSQPAHHPIFGKLFPSDTLFRLGDLVLIVRRPSVSLQLQIAEEWTYWLVPYSGR